MNKSVVSKEYLNLQKEIIGLQEQWGKEIHPDSVKLNINKANQEACIPIAAATEINQDISLFFKWMKELEDCLVKNNPQLIDQFKTLNEVFDETTAVRWFDESFSVNHVYFSDFAVKHNLQEWLPQFLAETLFRPYLQTIAQKAQGTITHAVAGCGCPVCGEPVRLGQIEGKGQKVLHCPRCLAHWLDKKIACSHCGNEDHGTIEFLTIDGDASSQIHICEKCKGYTKVIDTRQYLSKPQVPILDLNTIHLDYIAQEKGYNAWGKKHSGVN